MQALAQVSVLGTLRLLTIVAESMSSAATTLTALF
jgi:hypothetical protein